MSPNNNTRNNNGYDIEPDEETLEALAEIERQEREEEEAAMQDAIEESRQIAHQSAIPECRSQGSMRLPFRARTINPRALATSQQMLPARPALRRLFAQTRARGLRPQFSLPSFAEPFSQPLYDRAEEMNDQRTTTLLLRPPSRQASPTPPARLMSQWASPFDEPPSSRQYQKPTPLNPGPLKAHQPVESNDNDNATPSKKKTARKAKTKTKATEDKSTGKDKDAGKEQATGDTAATEEASQDVETPRPPRTSARQSAPANAAAATPRHPVSITTPVTASRPATRNLRSQPRKYYGGEVTDALKDVTVKLLNDSNPTYTEDAKLPTRETVGSIVVNTWEEQLNDRTAIWHKRSRRYATSTQQSAIAAQASSQRASEPCNKCAETGGVFVHCAINASWPTNGACVSCGYWGKTHDCSFATGNTSTTPKRNKQVDKFITTVMEQTKNAAEALRSLDDELTLSEHVNLVNAITDPEELLADCEKVIEYFNLRQSVEEDMDRYENE
ncbi:hypothetical protein KEM55_002962, partial [Ascosphaera atra]